MATGRPSARPVLLCAAAAVAGHVALLNLAASAPSTGSKASRGAHERLLHISLQPAPGIEATAGPMAVEQPPPPSAEPPRAATATDDAGSAPAMSQPPAFVAGLPDVPLPDELLPDGGVQLRVFLRVGAEGQVLDVATAVRPADASAAFALISERALADARLRTAGHDQVHCLVLDFQAGMPAPAWAWRPDASAQQCLTSRTAAKPLPAP
ncbi:MAG TPA: hypothetical protein VGE36_06230 [Roseateles sp.]